MLPRVLLLGVLVGCTEPQPVQTIAIAPKTTASAAPTSSGACATSAPEGRDADVDGDGTPDRIVKGYRDVTIYARRGACFVLFATLDTGPVAFVDVIERGTGVRDLSIDTWLFHGDRTRTTWSWSGGSYHAGREEEIPGPRR